MTKRLSSKHKVDRRLKANLWGRPKSPFNSRNYPPGQHGKTIKSKKSDHIQEELGDVLFSIVNLSRHIDMNPEVALDKSIIKFIHRFHSLERHMDKNKLDFKNQSLSDLDKLWDQIKKEKN